MPEEIQTIPEITTSHPDPFGAPLPMTYTGTVGAAGVWVSQTQVQLRADNSPFAEAALFIATVPQDMRSEALSMMKDEQTHRHHMEEQVMNNEQVRALDAQEKNYQLHQMWMQGTIRSDYFGKVLAIVILVAYFSFLGYAIHIGNSTAINALTGAGVLGLITTCIAHVIKGRNTHKAEIVNDSNVQEKGK